MATSLSRRQRERLLHRKEILDAALRLFSRKGFGKVTMANIAEESEFSVGTVYNFFKDKEAVYCALILETVEECHNQLAAVLKEPGTEIEKLERYIERKAALFVKHVPTSRIYFSQTSGAAFQPIAGLDREARAIYGKILSSLESVFRSGIRKKLFVRENPKMLALGLEGLSNGFLAELIERPDDFSAETMAGLAKKIFFKRIYLKAR